MSPIETPHWYVVYTKLRKEAFVECQIQRKGIVSFFPQLLIPVTSARRAQRHIVPLFPNYLFARIQESREYDCVRWTPGVSYIVSFHGMPAPIDDAAIQFLQQHTSSQGYMTAKSTVTAGQETRINVGPLAGLAGVIQNPPNARGRVKVLLSLLGREVSVNIPVHAIESEWHIA